MGLQRGTYGIEYDQNQKTSTGKLWLLPVIIPLVVILLVVRGCLVGSSDGIYSSDDTSQHEPMPPEVEVQRERPSIVSHFLHSWRNSLKGKAASGEELAAQDKGVSPDEVELPEKKREAEPVKVQNLKVSDEVARLLKRVDELEDGGELVSARMILQKLRLRPDGATVRSLVEKKIGEINIKLILSDKSMPGKLLHKIQSGDLVSKLIRRYKNTEEYILRVNKIDRPERIRIGQELWVLDNPNFELMIDKSDFKAVLLFNNRFFKVYIIGLGAVGTVPAGRYEVRSRTQSKDEFSHDRYSVLLKAAAETPSVRKFGLNAARSESHLGRISEESGVMFSRSGVEELYVLLPAGSMVTIVE
ncbi:MAG: LysM domain-containing protein [Kiritimatiellae bacterium]|jgi:LysM repeat protein|nr:LysM domain-containing protein [Kiritimatiellia bacterium]